MCFLLVVPEVMVVVPAGEAFRESVDPVPTSVRVSLGEGRGTCEMRSRTEVSSFRSSHYVAGVSFVPLHSAEGKAYLFEYTVQFVKR